jgi:glyoxylase-like metal-dependent hydrolase (beta-lactamase superfamily II)
MATSVPAVTEPVPLDRRLIAPLPRAAGLTRAEEVADALWCLRVPLPYQRTRSVNCFLLASRGGWTLVDCGSGVGAGWGALERALALAGVEPRAVTTLVLTHLHADHASLAGEAVRRLGCELIRLAGPDVCTDRLREPTVALDARLRAARAEGVTPRDVEQIVDASLAGDGRQPRPAADRLLAPGDVLHDRWAVIPAPGHSPAQMALFDARRRVLISADLAYPDIRPYLEWGHTADPVVEYIGTLNRTEALAPALALPGHGRPDRRPGDRFASARAALRDLVERVEGALGPAPSSAYDVTCRITGDDPDPDLRASWLSCALCVLEHLAARDRVTVEPGADGVRRFTRAGGAG